MAPCAFDAHKGSPEVVLRCETLTSDEPWPLSGGVSTGELWGKCQEQFIHHLAQTTVRTTPTFGLKRREQFGIALLAFG
jgi:hypothetical protein